MIFQDKENKEPQNLWGTLVSREGIMRREYGAESIINANILSAASHGPRNLHFLIKAFDFLIILNC